MTRLLLMAALAAFAVTGASAQSPATCNAATIPICGIGGGNTVQVKPQAVPTSTAAVTKTDAYLATVTVSNPTSGALTFTLADGQASPIAALGAVSVAANATYVVVWPAGYWCPGGFTILASSTGLTWYGAWKQ